MNSKSIKSSSLIQGLIDKYIFYVLLNKNHKKHVIENLGYNITKETQLNLA